MFIFNVREAEHVYPFSEQRVPRKFRRPLLTGISIRIRAARKNRSRHEESEQQIPHRTFLIVEQELLLTAHDLYIFPK